MLNRSDILKPFVLFLAFIIVVSVACQINAGGPTPPPTTVAVSTEAAESVEATVSSAQVESETGQVTITLTQEQLTALLAAKLQTQEKPFITNPQVVLKEGQAEIYGQVNNDTVTANVLMVISVSVDEKGMPKLTLVSADFGPIPAPSGLTDALSTMVYEGMTSSFGSAATRVKIISITISDGLMTLVAVKQ
jgi:uncharacterized protein YpmS